MAYTNQFECLSHDLPRRMPRITITITKQKKEDIRELLVMPSKGRGSDKGVGRRTI